VIFTWYWLADLCAKEGIAFVLGHALYIRAIALKVEQPQQVSRAGGDMIDSWGQV
jgi:hypothetical protein